MLIIDNILLALSNLKVNKMRAILTMLGIIIGIGSVIAIMTIGNSLSGSVSDSLSSFGINNLTVSLTKKDSDSFSNVRMFGPSSPSEEDLITDEMIEEYRDAYGKYIKYISISESVGSSSVLNGDASTSLNIKGVNLDVKDADELNIISGRFINDADLVDEKKVCVLSDYAAEELFNTTSNIIGQKLDITINNSTFSFYVVGLYEYDEDETVSLESSTTTTTLYIPLTTAKKINKADEGYQSFTVSCSTEADTSQFLNATTNFFASYYTRNESYTVEASSMESMVETMTEMLSTITLAISAIAAISLLVGGIGVMNIMLVSITERTKEIGIRKALGASEGIIKFQFIIEAIVICLIGGILGISVGLLLGSIGCKVLGYETYPNIITCLYAALFSMGIGVFFGYYPASKAAKLDPIEALRYE